MTEGPRVPFYSTGLWQYDVFLNFRGADTRAAFTGDLYNSLQERGIRTFMDDSGLRRGQQISSSLLRAIEESRVAIVVFSPTYASSAYCLDELVHILGCCKGPDKSVLPVFVDVDPSEVRHQRGAYGEALAVHEEQLQVDMEKLQQWREALYDAANLSGWHIKQRCKSQYMFIQKIIEEVSRKIKRTLLHTGNHLVGLESQVLKVTSLLELESDERVIMLAIWGMGGIGKTTLARAVYNLISGQFEGLCFLADIRQKSYEHGLVKLQETLLSEIVEEKDIKFSRVSEIVPILKHRLHRKKVLLILDNVDTVKQLQSLAGGYDWFGSGSRIIITTRDRYLLGRHGVTSIYTVKPLNEEEALELFSWKAFENNEIDPSYMDISKCVVQYTRGLPLVLEIIGSNLFSKEIGEWRSVVDKYELSPISDIRTILRVSYDSLDEDAKTILLDVACCFNGYRLEYVADLLLNGRGFHPEYGFQVLISKSLIKIDGGLVRMHDLIEDLGRIIVRLESPRDLGQRSRLWFHEDILYVLENNKGSDRVELMKIDLPEGAEVHWDGKAFGNMKNLKILEIINARFSRVPTHFPNNLRVLNWKGYFR